MSRIKDKSKYGSGDLGKSAISQVDGKIVYQSKNSPSCWVYGHAAVTINLINKFIVSHLDNAENVIEEWQNDPENSFYLNKLYAESQDVKKVILKLRKLRNFLRDLSAVVFVQTYANSSQTVLEFIDELEDDIDNLKQDLKEFGFFESEISVDLEQINDAGFRTLERYVVGWVETYPIAEAYKEEIAIFQQLINRTSLWLFWWSIRFEDNLIYWDNKNGS